MKYRNKMSSNRLYLVIAIPILLFGLTLFYFAYQKSLSVKHQYIEQEISIVADLISQVALFDQRYSNEADFGYNPLVATLSQIQKTFAAHNHSSYYEYLVAEHRDGEIRFLAYSKIKPNNVAWSNIQLAIPMRKALMGESGIIDSTDYQNNEVYAAFQPIKGTEWGLVIKEPIEKHFYDFYETTYLIFTMLIILLFIVYIFLTRNERKNRHLLYESEKRFLNVIESTDNIIWELDINKRFTMIGDQAKNLLGYREKELLHTSPFDLVPEKDRTALIKEFEYLAINKENIHDMIAKCTHKNGETVYLLVNGSPILDHYNRLIGYRGFSKDITDSIHQQRKMKFLAYHDHLTSLENRKSIVSRIEEEIAYASRNPVVSAILFLDLDEFKYINDALGHDYGDIVLKEIAKRIKETTRRFDIVGRIGGDEFVVLIRSIPKDEMQFEFFVDQLVSRLISTINEPIMIKKKAYSVGASIGIAIVNQDGESALELLKHADSAMYKAKNGGKNRAVYFEESFQDEIDSLLERKNALLRAFQNNEFELYYQKQYDINRTQCIGCEALIRWNQKDRGVVLPAEFLQDIASFNLSLELDKWVFKRACEDVKALEPLIDDETKISINLSVKSFEDSSFEEWITQNLHKNKIKTSRFTLEITEDMLFEDIDKGKKTIAMIKQLGFTLAMDDFGTGYSSLSYLSQFDFDIIKIDKKFVSNIFNSQKDEKITNMIITLAKDLGAKIVAEGVETDGELKYLRLKEVDVIQGFIFARPESIKSLLLQKEHA